MENLNNDITTRVFWEEEISVFKFKPLTPLIKSDLDKFKKNNIINICEQAFKREQLLRRSKSFIHKENRP